jgi:hypothetical protein
MSAPQHSATAPIRFIPRTDPAWHLDEFPAEVEAMGDRAGEHPIGRYFRGEGRFDLDAASMAGVPEQEGDEAPVRCARDYLRAGSKPTTWLLRRLRIGELAHCKDTGGHQGALMAFRLALVGVENAPAGVDVPAPSLARQLNEKQADVLAEQLGANVVFDIGEAAMLASQAPTSAEKKL